MIFFYDADKIFFLMKIHAVEPLVRSTGASSKTGISIGIIPEPESIVKF